MKNTLFALFSLLLISCFSEPKKDIKNESQNVTANKNDTKYLNDKTESIASKPQEEKDERYLKFEETLNGINTNNLNYDNSISIGNLEKIVNLNTSKVLTEWLMNEGYQIATVEDTDGDEKVISNVFYNKNQDFLRYITDSDFNPLGIISYHPKDIKKFKALKEECINKNYNYYNQFTGNLLHNKVAPNDVVGFTNGSITIYFSGFLAKDYMVTIVK